MRFRRQGLTPLRVILAYALTLTLVLGHEANHLADWLTDLGRAEAGPGRALALNLAADLRAAARSTGLTSLVQAEGQLFQSLTPTLVVGASLIEKSPPPNPETPPATAGLAVEPQGGLALAGLAGPAQSGLTTQPDSPPLASPAPSEPAKAPSSPVLEISLQPTKPAFQRILLVGDSMMLEGLGPPLQKTLAARPGLEVSREGRYATGLCRLDVFDWLEYFAGLLAQKSPDLVIITLGANDTQDIVDDQGRRHLVTTASWRELYGERVLALLGLAEAAQAQVLWIGLPVMGREPYNARALAINEVDQAACQAAKNCRFLDTWNLLAEDGRYATFLPMAERRLRVRAKDQIHLTEAGGKILTEAVLEYLLSYASLGPPEESTAEISSPRELGPGPENRAVIADPALVPKGLVPPAPTIFPPASQPPAEAPQEASPSPAATLSGPPASDLAANQPQVSPPEPGAPGPPPPTNLSRPPTSSLAALAEISLDSKALGREVKYLAYVPQAPGPFPAVFLLPGLGESHQAFAQRLGPSLWQLAEARRLLLVMVDPVGPSWYLDSPGQASSRYKTHFFRELLPHALARLPIQPDRLGLLGLGMGGHGALSLALTEPGRFGAIAALSPVTDLSLHPDDQPQNPAALRIEAALGPYNERPNLWRGASAYWLTRQNPQALADSRLFLSVGRSDQLVLAENRQYHRLLSELSLPHQYREDSGGHDWEFWARQLPTHLGFLAESLAARP